MNFITQHYYNIQTIKKDLYSKWIRQNFLQAKIQTEQENVFIELVFDHLEMLGPWIWMCDVIKGTFANIRVSFSFLAKFVA